jgi:hypothetical protein
MITVAPDSRFLDHPVHALDLTIRPRVVRFGQTMLDIVLCAGQYEGMAAKEVFLGEQLLDFGGCPAVFLGVCEMRPVSH